MPPGTRYPKEYPPRPAGTKWEENLKKEYKNKNKGAGNKASSASVRRKLLTGRMQGRSGELTEDTPGFNPQTMGNRLYKTDSKAYRELEEMGQAREVKAPNKEGRGRFVLGKKLPRAAITRRLEMQRVGVEAYKRKNKAKSKKEWVAKPLKERETISQFVI